MREWPKEEAMPSAGPKRQRVWVMAKTLSSHEKAAIATTCEGFISAVLKPKFLPEIKTTEFNYPVDIFGKWRGSSYSFIVRFRSGFPENKGEEFESGFARLDYAPEGAETRFHVMWRRHTGQWWPIYFSLTLEEALAAIETDGVLRPPI
jgi:hypothetical protein